MASIESDSTVTPQPVRSHRRRWAWITIATVGVVSASAFIAIPAIAENSNPPSHDTVVVCDSGIETNGDVQISAATATRVADGDTTPLREGCQAG